jgi:hypothetical protein
MMPQKMVIQERKSKLEFLHKQSEITHRHMLIDTQELNQTSRMYSTMVGYEEDLGNKSSFMQRLKIRT